MSIKSENYRITWRHHNNLPIGKNNKMSKTLNSKRESHTECLIIDNETNQLFVSSVAYLHPKDKNYNKAIGRKVSFNKAVEQVENKELRQELWDAFKRDSPKSLNSYSLK